LASPSWSRTGRARRDPRRRAVAKAEPDGYTIPHPSNGFTVAPAVYPNLPYDPINDFIPITTLGYFRTSWSVAPSKNIPTLQKLIAEAKANPAR